VSASHLNKVFKQANEYWLRTRNTVRWMARGFQPIRGVLGATYIQLAPDLAITKADPEAVNSAARILEATLVMAEDIPHEELLVFQMTKLELASFVCYMRQLDQEYRRLLLETAEPRRRR
jgi:hypothetical protein